MNFCYRRDLVSFEGESVRVMSHCVYSLLMGPKPKSSIRQRPCFDCSCFEAMLQEVLVALLTVLPMCGLQTHLLLMITPKYMVLICYFEEVAHEMVFVLDWAH